MQKKDIINRKYFGTDGIRGKANIPPITADIAMKLGMAAGSYFNNGGYRHRVIIGKDTRLSGYLLEPALTAGFISVGMDVMLMGPIPTPAVAMLTRSMRADLGVMISASHNMYQDNGIKLFGPDGYKLSDAVEYEIEQKMSDSDGLRVDSADLGRAQRLENARGRYIEFAKNSFPKGMTLNGLKILLDCANGAAYNVGPIILWELGAEVISHAIDPNGTNINHQCGSMYPNKLAEAVLSEGADLGIALDGDADRLIMCDECGNIIDGDQLLAMIATYQQQNNILQSDYVVATKMSNLALEHYLAEIGLSLIRTEIGDRYVAEAMRQYNSNLGGEQSGHIILGDHATTGDGLVAALQLLAYMIHTGKPLSEISQPFTPLPQILENIPCSDAAKIMKSVRLNDAIAQAKNMLGGNGRILVRKSGTEELIRIMAEGSDRALLENAINIVADAIEE